jgi:hypothetical protein
LLPLFAESGREYQQDTAAAFGPPLRNHQGRFDGLAKAHFVGKDHALR